MEKIIINEIKNQIEGATEEANLLQEFAEHLETASKSKNDEYKLLVLDENMKMWVAIESSIKNPNNFLPQNIKDNLAKLSKYVEQVTISKGVDMTESYFQSLANINRQISQGLLDSVTASLAQQEAYYLAKCGLDLSEASKANDSDLLVSALDNNQRLWVMIKTVMNNGKTKLPNDVRNNLIKLADYIALNTIKIGQNLNNDNRKMIDSFISINRHISEGLLGHR